MSKIYFRLGGIGKGPLPGRRLPGNAMFSKKQCELRLLASMAASLFNFGEYDATGSLVGHVSRIRLGRRQPKRVAHVAHVRK